MSEFDLALGRVNDVLASSPEELRELGGRLRFIGARDCLPRDDTRVSERTRVRVSEGVPRGVAFVLGDRQTVAIVNGELVELEERA